jgi:hypothetical protein
VRHVWIFVHLLGFVIWLGGGLSSMFIGLATKQDSPENLRPILRALAVNARMLLLPGSLATLVSGLVLSLIMYGSAGGLGVSPYLMAMQALGLIGAIVTLVFLVPNAGRLAQVDPATHPVQFAQMRQKQSRLGMISGLFAMAALVAGALGRP